MRQKIELKDREVRKTIIKAFGITESNLSQALNFRRNSENAKKIRTMALRNGGKLLQEVEN